jgi:hypothetical protein
MTKSAKEKCCDAISKGLTRITAIVRPMQIRYTAFAGIVSASIREVTIR